MPSIATRNPAPGDMRPLWLTGQIEMTDGLAFLGNETQMVVKRTFNGENFETGRIWVSEGKFEIHVKRPMGFLRRGITNARWTGAWPGVS